jgi:peptidyl-prolyl cis-trans isomerase SurA
LACFITRSEYERNRDELRNEIKQANVPNPDQVFAEKDKDTLKQIIDQKLLIQKGKDLGITADAELIKRMDEIRKNAGLGSMEELEKAAEQQGVNYEEWKQNLRDQIITRQVIQREVGQKLQITQEELQAYYEKHKQEMAQPEQVRLSEILIPTETPAADSTPDKPNMLQMSDEQVAQQKGKAEQVLAQLKAGKSFEDMAKQYSGGPTAAQGGDLGLFKRGVMAKELEDKTFDQMKQGDISDVLRTKQGFVILKVSEHNKPGVPALKEVEDKVQEGVYFEKLQPALRAYLTKLREDAFIDIKQGYVDSGASPNETKPVYTAGPINDPTKKKESRKFYCMWLCKS